MLTYVKKFLSVCMIEIQTLGLEIGTMRTRFPWTYQKVNKITNDEKGKAADTIVVVKSSPRQSIPNTNHGFGYRSGLLQKNVSKTEV